MNGSLSSFVSITTILWNFGEFQKSGFDACCYKTGGQSQAIGNPQFPAQMKTCSNMQELVKIIQDMKVPEMSIVLRKKDSIYLDLHYLSSVLVLSCSLQAKMTRNWAQWDWQMEVEKYDKLDAPLQ